MKVLSAIRPDERMYKTFSSLFVPAGELVSPAIVVRGFVDGVEDCAMADRPKKISPAANTQWERCAVMLCTSLDSSGRGLRD